MIKIDSSVEKETTLTAHRLPNFQDLHGDALHQVKTLTGYSDGPATTEGHTRTEPRLSQEENEQTLNPRYRNSFLTWDGVTAVKLWNRHPARNFSKVCPVLREIFC